MEECVGNTRENSVEKLTKFSEKSWKTFVECAKQWRDIVDGKYSDIAIKTENIWLGSNANVSSFQYQYHRGCYQDFTNKTSLVRAKKRPKESEGKYCNYRLLFLFPMCYDMAVKILLATLNTSTNRPSFPFSSATTLCHSLTLGLPR